MKGRRRAKGTNSFSPGPDLWDGMRKMREDGPVGPCKVN